MKTKLNVFVSVVSDLFAPMIIVFLFLIAMCLGSCSHGERKYVYFGDDGYTQCDVIGNDSIAHILYNNGTSSYYITTLTDTSHHSWILLGLTDSYKDWLYSEIEVHPGDTVIIKKPTEIRYRWKGLDECGHEIPFNYIEYVGYWEDGEFHRKE